MSKRLRELINEAAAEAEAARGQADHAPLPPHVNVSRPNRRFTDEEYAEMAADYEANPPRADEILSIEINPACLHNDRQESADAIQED